MIHIFKCVLQCITFTSVFLMFFFSQWSPSRCGKDSQAVSGLEDIKTLEFVTKRNIWKNHMEEVKYHYSPNLERKIKKKRLVMGLLIKWSVFPKRVTGCIMYKVYFFQKINEIKTGFLLFVCLMCWGERKVKIKIFGVLLP